MRRAAGRAAVSGVARRPLRRLLGLAIPERRRFLIAAALGALAIGSSVALMATSGYLISKASLVPEILSLTVAIVAVRLFGVSRGVFRYLERLASHEATLRLLATLRVRFYERLEPLAPGGLPNDRRGDLLSRFVADVEALQHLYLRGMGPPLVALTVGGGSVAASALFLPEAGLWLALGLVAAGVAVPLAAVALVSTLGRREAAARARLSSEVLELLAATPELVAYERAGVQLARIDDADRRLEAVARRSALAAGAGEGGLLLVAGLTVVAVLASGVRATASGALRGVLLAALVLLVTAAFEAVRPLPEAAQQLVLASGAAARLLELTERPAPVVDPVDPLPLPLEGDHVLRLERARFRYGPDEPWILDGVDLELRTGGLVALVGPSGAGKSTLAQLLVRFREPEQGLATLDGHDLAAYAQDDLRQVVALSGQDAHLFATSVRANVGLARPQATDAEIVAALRRARAWEWVRSLPDGIDADVGEAGSLISGGERQRLALARAFLSRAPLLILDEPTAHLDAATAAALLHDLVDSAAGTGILLITHAPEGLDRFDVVLRLDHGKIRPL
jgi:ATP-binding cassette subfamily C protein CydC